MITVFDVETNPRPFNQKLASTDPRQPRCVSIAMVSFDDTMTTVVQSLYSLLRPCENVITKKAAGPGDPVFHNDDRSKACEINGITQEMLEKYGIRMMFSIPFIYAAFARSKWVLSFNKSHDIGMMEVEQEYHKKDLQEIWPKTHCVMLAMADLMKIPNRHGYQSWAWPKLCEAYDWCFHKEMPNAHHALGDVEATAEIVKHIAVTNHLWTPRNPEGLPPTPEE